MERIDELKALGWNNMNAEQREEYRSLKKGETPKTNQEKDTTTTASETKEEETPETPETTTPETEEKKDIEMTVSLSPYRFRQNTKYHGAYYKKGDRMPDATREEITELVQSDLIELC